MMQEEFSFPWKDSFGNPIRRTAVVRANDPEYPGRLEVSTMVGAAYLILGYIDIDTKNRKLELFLEEEKLRLLHLTREQIIDDLEAAVFASRRQIKDSSG